MSFGHILTLTVQLLLFSVESQMFIFYPIFYYCSDIIFLVLTERKTQVIYIRYSSLYTQPGGGHYSYNTRDGR